MKTFIWLVILSVLFIGGFYFYKNYLTKPESKTEKTEQAAKTETAKPKEKPNSEKGIENWRAVKKVRDLNDKHNKDLENNM